MAFNLYLLLYDGNMYKIPKSARCQNIEKNIHKKNNNNNNHKQDSIYIIRQFVYVHKVIRISLKKPKYCNSVLLKVVSELRSFGNLSK